MAMMTAYINVENWVADQVAAWLRGLDNVVLPYVHFFLNNGINGKKLLMLCHEDLEDFGITKLGHQELILEAVDLLRALYFGLEMETLQSVTLQLGCKSKCLHNELARVARDVENDMNSGNVAQTGLSYGRQRLPVSVLSSVADILTALKVVISWLDRAPFESMFEIKRNTLVKIGLDLISVTQRDHQRPEAEEAIKRSCTKMSDICDEIVIKSKDPLVIQPTSLELATIRKKPGEELGMHIQSSYYGIHAIGGVRDLSPAFLCGKIEKGDEVIAVNHQIVVGWHLQKLVLTLKEKPKEVVLLLKKRPHHINPFGNVPNKKKISQKQQAATLPSITKRRSRDGDKQARPSLQELVSVSPPAEEPGYSSNSTTTSTSVRRSRRLPTLPAFDENELPDNGSISAQDGNDTDNEVFRSGSESPKYKLEAESKPRRATVSGGSPTLERPALIIEDLDGEENETSAFSSPDSGDEDLRPSATYTHKLEVPESPLILLNRHRDYSCRSDSPEDVNTPEPPPLKKPEFRLTRSESQKSHKIECPQPIIAAPPPPPPPPDETSELSTPLTSAPADARKSRAVHEVAGAQAVKSQPMLMKIRKLDSIKLLDKEDKDSGDSGENSDTERSTIKSHGSPVSDDQEKTHTEKDTSSYTVTIVGGVIQKMPTGTTGVVVEKPTPPESPAVMRRHHRPGKRMDRRVSCKDLGRGDCEGWLYKKKKSHSSLLTSKWHKRWFVLKNYNLYYYKHQEDLRAEGVIHLPSFKVSPEAAEVKGFTHSRKMHAFKVYNTGTAFFFASDRHEDMTKWMNKMGLAAIVYAPKDGKENNPTSHTHKQQPIHEDDDYSESDDDVESGIGDNLNSSDKTDEYTSILRNLEKADLAIDGTNINEKRRSAITSVDMLKEPSSGHSDALRRIVLLERTIKSKELLVKAIDRLLNEEVTQSRLLEFKENYPDLFHVS